MSHVRGVYLLGLRGTGKTTLGEMLAGSLGFSFLDSDRLLMRQCGKPAGEILRELGETRFRGEESRLLDGLMPELVRGERVLALGGGSPEAPGVEHKLAELRTDHSWLGVWVELEPEELVRRLGEHAAVGRPRLVGRSLEEENRLLLARRASLYARLADIRFRNAPGGAEERAEELLELLNDRWEGVPEPADLQAEGEDPPADPSAFPGNK
ncbi:MAG: shikimate kinase [Planctomycetota bacterium]